MKRRLRQLICDGIYSAKIYWDVEWKEYVVKFFKSTEHLGEDCDAHTDDWDDALATANSELKRCNEINR